jgi:hypothetical protein
MNGSYTNGKMIHIDYQEDLDPPGFISGFSNDIDKLKDRPFLSQPWHGICKLSGRARDNN